MSSQLHVSRYARIVLWGAAIGASYPVQALDAQPVAATPTAPGRAIRRDIPLTNAIKRAFAAGTRDSTGRPGRAYWKLRTDYRIDVALEPSTQRLTGTARITIHNTSPDALTEIRLRLDPNHFLGNAPHAAPWVPAEVTDGMVITRLVVDGKA
ncbi:MAG: M1 family peptidase, partial [Gemmatimonas sp.]